MIVGAHLHVVSGCSGSGKSALIAALAKHGEVVSGEPGRQIVQNELLIGGDGLPWESIFCPDAERRHGFSDAVAEYEVLVPTYRRHGYEIVFIPHTSVAQRVSFILSTLAA